MAGRMPHGETFGQAPDRLVAACGPEAALLWGYVRARQGDGPVALALATLAAYLGCGPRHVQDLARRLEAAGWLGRRRTGRATLYATAVPTARAVISTPDDAHQVRIRSAPGALQKRTPCASDAHSGAPRAGPPLTTPPVGVTAERGGGREATATAPPPPSLRDQVKQHGGDVVAALVEGYQGRTIHRVPYTEAAACITDDLRGAYRPDDLAAYLDATPHVRAWPRDLAAAVAVYLNHRNATAAAQKRLAAWSAWRRRVALLAPGEALWQKDLERLVWRVTAIDAEGGVVKAVRRDSGGRRYETEIRTPEEGAAWVTEAETMPLLHAAAPAAVGRTEAAGSHRCTQIHTEQEAAS